MIAIAVIAIVAAIAIPSLLNSHRSANERNASGSLKSLATAQADFRSNDRDINRVQDFWTGDVAGLFSIDDASTGAAPPSAIRLIDLGLALADLSTMPGSLVNRNYGTPVTAYGIPSAKAGCWYWALIEDLQATLNGGNGVPRQDTEGAGMMCHNTSRFACAALPESYGTSGTKAFIVNEANTMFTRDCGTDVLATGPVPPLPTWAFDGRWPVDATLSAQWSKLDSRRRPPPRAEFRKKSRVSQNT